jgi:phospholipid N-methyltransferase
MVTENMMFLFKFLKSPRKVGSIILSSPYLIKSMLDSVNWSETASIAELGTGTGVVSQEIQKRMQSKTQFFVFEQDFEMRLQLSHIATISRYVYIQRCRKSIQHRCHF